MKSLRTLCKPGHPLRAGADKVRVRSGQREFSADDKRTRLAFLVERSQVRVPASSKDSSGLDAIG